MNNTTKANYSDMDLFASNLIWWVIFCSKTVENFQILQKDLPVCKSCFRNAGASLGVLIQLKMNGYTGKFSVILCKGGVRGGKIL